MGMPSVGTLTMFRMNPLQSNCYDSSGGHRSFTVTFPGLRRRGGGGVSGLGNIVEGWTRHTRRCVKVAGRSCSPTITEGFNVGQSARQEIRRPAVVRGLEKASDNSDSTNFFLDELIEAKTTIEKLAEPENSVDQLHSWQEEGTSQQKEDSEKPPSKYSNWEVSRSGKLPLESNGPPMAILRAYLVTDNSQEQGKEKLPQLPLPMPHKVRPAGLPRPSLRRRLGVAYSRKAVPVGLEIESLPEI